MQNKFVQNVWEAKPADVSMNLLKIVVNQISSKAFSLCNAGLWLEARCCLALLLVCSFGHDFCVDAPDQAPWVDFFVG